MPGFDQTGPENNGPMTGRGLGRCARNAGPEDQQGSGNRARGKGNCRGRRGRGGSGQGRGGSRAGAGN